MSSDPTPTTATPARLVASFYDGKQSRPLPVQLQIDAGGIALYGAELQRRYRWSDSRISESLEHAPRLIEFADGSHCEIEDKGGLEAALEAAGYRESWVARSQRSWSRVLVATAILAATIFVLYRWGLPLGADFAARRVPPAYEARIGVKAADIMEQRFPPSKLSSGPHDRVHKLFGSIAPRDGRTFRLVLRDGGPIGANAFALPGGTVVVTDQLVELAPDDAALAGVLAHEIGHIERRHLMRQIISGAVVGALVALIGGDVSTLTAALPAALAELSYSRDMELEADAYAVELLKQRAIPVEPYVELLERLQRGHETGEEPRWARYLQTHPDTKARIAAIRALR